MKILHIADLHLDSAFSGFDKDTADQKREALRNCFCKALRVAKERDVSLVLIPGDLFDTPYCTLTTRKKVFEAIEDFARPVVIAPGNHDYYTKNGTYTDRSLPENAFVFTSNELGRFDFDELGVSVIGYAFTSDRYERSPLDEQPPLSDTNINILCAHGELCTGFSRYAAMTHSQIAEKGFTYAALGHVHIAPEPQKLDHSLIAYSGFPQGRSFDETGEGGAYIVDIDTETREVMLERITLSELVYKIDRLDVTNASSNEDVIEAIDRHARDKGYSGNIALRIVLEGSVDAAYTVNSGAIEAASELSYLALLQVRNKTVATLGLEHLERDMTIRGEIYRSLLPMLRSTDPQAREKASLALKFALNALDKRELGVD